MIYHFSSSLICNILVDAHAADKKFRVIVVDGRPWLEGREQLRRLAKHGIDCSYMYINAVSFIMPEVSNGISWLMQDANCGVDDAQTKRI